MNATDVALPIVLITLLVLILLSGIAIAFFTISRQRQRQREILTQARLDFEREVRQVEFEIREELISHFSRELHDNLGHQLTGLRLAVENLKLDQSESGVSFRDIDDCLTAASQQVRMISRSLSRDYIFDLDLEQALRLEIERYNHLARFKLSWLSDHGSPLLTKTETLVVFRIFQEVMTNILRHSGADRVWVELREQDSFYLRIKDNGCGFNLEEILVPSKSFGIKNINKRAAIMGLHCQIETQKDKGCEYLFTKPRNN